jgi:hypothetical protein
MDNYRLNDYVGQLIETKGIEYVVENYLVIREAYYEQKQYKQDGEINV